MQKKRIEKSSFFKRDILTIQSNKTPLGFHGERESQAYLIEILE